MISKMDYSEIWSQLAALENNDQEPDSSLVSEYICKCGGTKCMTDTVFTCTSCGVMDHQYIDDNPEWTGRIRRLATLFAETSSSMFETALTCNSNAVF